MRLLKRNTTPFEYLRDTGEETDLNEHGEHTGDFHPVYGEPETFSGNISTPSGHTNQTFYGEDIRYTHVLLMDEPDPGIREDGIIRWKGEQYDIVAIHPSLNSVSIALRQQTAGHVPEEPDEPDEPEEPEDGEEGETGDGEGE